MEEQVKKILGLLVSNLRKTENFLLEYSVFLFLIFEPYSGPHDTDLIIPTIPQLYEL